MPIEPARLELLSALARKVLWLSSWTIHHANHIRPNADGLKVGGHQASSASLANIMSALYFSVLRPQDRVAVKPHASPVFHAIQYLFGHQTREKLENFRGYKGAQSYPSRTKDVRRRRFLHRLGRPRRRADVVLLAGAGLRQGAWLAERSPGGADDRAGRRRRNGRGQHLRGAAGGLEARAAQHLVDRRLQPPEPRCGRSRRPLGKIRIHVPQFRLGRGDREIRHADAGGIRRARRRGAEALDRRLPEPDVRRAVFPGRRRVPQASPGRHRRSGAGLAIDRPAQRRGVAGADVQSRRPRHGQHDRCIRSHRSRPAGLLHRLHHQGRRPAVPGPQGQSCRVDDADADGKMARDAEYPSRP